jgi:iron complex outermembrane receptor protein
LNLRRFAIWTRFLLALAAAACRIAAAAPPGTQDNVPPGSQLSEQDFLAEIPRVLSASRLPQAPADAPVAVTVIDRDMIRESGARDLAELFEYVPGFVIGWPRGGRPVVTYHGLSGQISQRMQVLLDGRSLYAPYLFGGIDWASLTISLDEVERIEVLRGSNSTAYGANAFLGVANIITRSAAQSAGAFASLAAGNRGTRQANARFGSGFDRLRWRVSAGHREDEGLEGSVDSRRADYGDARLEWQLSESDELTASAGTTRGDYGIGIVNHAGDPPRDERLETSYGLVRWRRSLSPTHELSLTYSRTEDRGKDRYEIPITATQSLVIDYRRRATRDNLEYSHFLDLSGSLRASWGIEYRRDRVVAPQLFNTDAWQSTDATRGFANFEWKPSSHWTLNLGGLVEHESISGTEFAPRAVVNWKPAPEHTFRFGLSTAFRVPSLFEQRSDWRFLFAGETIDIRFLSRGGLRSERVNATELSYLGDWRRYGLQLDVRVFDERVRNLIVQELYALPPGQEFDPASGAFDLRNAASARIRGAEYQLRWRPSPRWSLLLNQFVTAPSASQEYLRASVAHYGGSLLASTRLGQGTTLSAGGFLLDSVRWIGEPARSPHQYLLHFRLGQSVRLAGRQVQVALTARVPLGSRDQFRPGQTMPREAWLSLATDF